MKKISITIITLCFTALMFGQNNTNPNKDKKDDQPTLSPNFYINEDGLMVYKHASQTESNTKQDTLISKIDTKKTDSISENRMTTTKVVRKEVYSQNLTKEENTEDIKDIDKSEIETTETTTNKFITKSPELADSTNTTESTESGVKIKKPNTTNRVPTTNNKTKQPTTTDSEQNNNKPKDPSLFVATKKKNEDEKQVEDTEKKYRKYGSYEKKEPEYKTVAEAALAIDEIIYQLKSENKKTTNPTSMSSRLSLGANKTGFIKKPLSENKKEEENLPQANRRNISTETDSNDSSWTEPTYYINGNEVERQEVDLLKKNDIISKEFKIKNTLSGNPNGEIWYEVSNYKPQ